MKAILIVLAIGIVIAIAAMLLSNSNKLVAGGSISDVTVNAGNDPTNALILSWITTVENNTDKALPFMGFLINVYDRNGKSIYSTTIKPDGIANIEPSKRYTSAPGELKITLNLAQASMIAGTDLSNNQLNARKLISESTGKIGVKALTTGKTEEYLIDIPFQNIKG